MRNRGQTSRPCRGSRSAGGAARSRRCLPSGWLRRGPRRFERWRCGWRRPQRAAGCRHCVSASRGGQAAARESTCGGAWILRGMCFYRWWGGAAPAGLLTRSQGQARAKVCWAVANLAKRAIKGRPALVSPACCGRASTSSRRVRGLEEPLPRPLASGSRKHRALGRGSGPFSGHKMTTCVEMHIACFAAGVT